MKHITGFILLLFAFTAQAQDSLNVLFIGNSYTYVNDLPLLVSQVAASNGDYVSYNSSAPGGYTFQQHCTNTTTTSLIAQGTWDYVVLQEQSQLPSFPIAQVESDVYPYATKLDSLINAANPCTETVFYNTWGRKNGDASNCANYPPLCTYVGMDSLLQLRYNYMALTNHALLSPVAQVWRYIRTNHPTVELYNPDESHPSVAGSYAAACTFYTILFRKDPLLITFNAGLDSATAAQIRHAAHVKAFSIIEDYHVGEYDPVAGFTYMQQSWCSMNFTSTSINADSLLWDFGDGTTSNEENPYHSYYPSLEEYFTAPITLIAYKCGMADTITLPVFINCTSGIDENNASKINIYPNPFTDNISIASDIKLPVSWQLINAVGQALQTGTGTSINGLQTLPAGLYLLKVNVGDRTTTKRLIKN